MNFWSFTTSTLNRLPSPTKTILPVILNRLWLKIHRSLIMITFRITPGPPLQLMHPQNNQIYTLYKNYSLARSTFLALTNWDLSQLSAQRVMSHSVKSFRMIHKRLTSNPDVQNRSKLSFLWFRRHQLSKLKRNTNVSSRLNIEDRFFYS